MVFSKRHRRVLQDGDLQIEIAEVSRRRLWRQLLDFGSGYSYRPDPNDNWTDQTSVLAELPDRLTSIYGTKDLGPRAVEASPLETFVVEGPDFGTFDAIELFVLGCHKQDIDVASLVRGVNDVFKEEGLSWRLLDGEVVLLDSDFHLDRLTEDVTTLVSNAGIHGALNELKRARNDRMDGHTRGAIHNAGSSYESVMKALGNRDSGQAKQLIEHLDSEGFFSGAPENVRVPLKKMVLNSLPLLRNELGAHGQGRNEVDVPDAYAELAINLAATLEKFLLELALERQGAETPAPAEEPAGFEDFVATGDFESGSDIPF